MILRLLPQDLRESIAGDLAEQHADVRRRHGRAIAAAWFWWNAVRLVAAFRWERLAHGRPLPPIGDELRGRTNMWDRLGQDIRYAIRVLTATPVFTATAIVTLALGIGAATAIYSLADATVLRPLPVRDPDRLYAMKWSVSHPAYRDYDARRDVFDGAIAFSNDSVSVQRGGESELVAGGFVSGNYFSVLGVGAQSGRVLQPSDDNGSGSPLVAVVSDRFWRARLGGEAAVLGRTLRVNGQDVTVVGVAPRGFRGTALQSAPAVWMPLANTRRLVTTPFFARVDPLVARNMVWLRVIARLKPDVTPAQASAALVAAYNANHPAPETPGDDRHEVGDIQPLAANAVGFSTASDLRRFLLLLAGVVVFALAIACANLANMLLARAASRRREIAVRLALGAGRARLIQQMLTESVMLASAGGAVGLLVTHWMVALLGRFMLPGRIPIQDLELSLSGPALAMAAGMSMLTGVLFGLAPAMQSAGVGIMPALKDHERSTGRHRLRAVLVASQVALSLALLAGGALFVRGVQRALTTDLGFVPARVAVATVSAGLARYDAARAKSVYEQALDRVSHVPSVRAAAWASFIPMRGLMTTMVGLDGYRPAAGKSVSVDTNFIWGRYFEALGVPLLEGRTFDDRDREGAAPVAIVTRGFATKYWRQATAVGRRFRLDENSPWIDIVGVVGDVRSRGLDQAPPPTIYLPFLQRPRLTMLGAATLVARGDVNGADLAAVLVRELRGVDPALPITRAVSLDDHLREQVLPQRMGLTLLTFFGVLALAIASVGIYGVAAYSVAERTRELGIRVALGAGRRHVIGLVQRETLPPVAAGLAIGAVLSIWTARLAGSLLFGLNAHDPASFFLVAAGLGAVAAVAAWIPARRAARVDPLIALRQD